MFSVILSIDYNFVISQALVSLKNGKNRFYPEARIKILMEFYQIILTLFLQASLLAYQDHI